MDWLVLSKNICEIQWNAGERHTFIVWGNEFTKLNNGGALKKWDMIIYCLKNWVYGILS